MGAGTAISLTGYASLPDFEESLRKIIEQDTASLKVKQEAIDQFLADAKKEEVLFSFSPKMKNLIIACTLAHSLNLPLPLKFDYFKYRTQIVSMFLLSTDFFHNKMNEQLPLTYTGFYNPYKRPCSSPFSSVYYPLG